MSSVIPGIGSIGTIKDVVSLSPQTGEAGASFGDVMKGALQQVNQLSGAANQQVGKLLSGSGNTEMSGVMIAVEKADVAFQLMMQVRNKIVSAYQDIEKMQF